jgi:hypothetical protein
MDLRTIWLVLLAGIISIKLALAQADLSTPPYRAANLWMTYPVPWSPATDAVPLDVRRERDKYFDDLIGLPSPLTPENARGSGLSEGARLGAQPEIFDAPNRAILIATFSQYQPVLSNSGRSVYTEVTLSVQDVFEDPAGTLPGNSIVLVLPGGTVKTDSGAALSFLAQPRQYFISAGRTYLFVMSYHADGKFYMLAQGWDLTDGSVRRNFATSKDAPANLNGLTVQELIKILRAPK